MHVLYSKLYDICYILHTDIKFADNLDEKILYHFKIPNCTSSQFIKIK